MAAKRASGATATSDGGRAAVLNGAPKPKRARRPGLTEEVLVDAALRIVQRVGVAGLSMRGLADELGVTQMAPYYHVSSKEELLARALNRLLAEVEIPATDYGTWDQRLRRRTEEIIDRLQKYPGIGDVLLGAAVPDHAARLVREVIKMLADEGFDDEQIRFIYWSVGLWMLGRLAYDARARLSGGVPAEQLVTIRVPSGTPHAEWGLSPSEYMSLQLGVVIEGVRAAVGEPAAKTGGASRAPTMRRSNTSRAARDRARR